MKSYVHVYTGNGKGKTTSAIGLSIRALGANKKVFFAQFVKGQKYSEVYALQKLLSKFEIHQYGQDCFIHKNPTKTDIEMAKKGFKQVADIIVSGEYDLVVLDEANIAIYYNLFSVEELIEVLKKRSNKTEVIITGRYAPKELIEFADLVTEMKEIKHYFNKGVEARAGIEF